MKRRSYVPRLLLLIGVVLGWGTWVTIAGSVSLRAITSRTSCESCPQIARNGTHLCCCTGSVSRSSTWYRPKVTSRIFSPRGAGN